MTCISQLIEGGVYLILYMVKKTTGPQFGHQMYVTDFSPKWKKERENQGTSLLDGRKDRITTH